MTLISEAATRNAHGLVEPAFVIVCFAPRSPIAMGSASRRPIVLIPSWPRPGSLMQHAPHCPQQQPSELKEEFDPCSSILDVHNAAAKAFRRRRSPVSRG